MYVDNFFQREGIYYQYFDDVYKYALVLCHNEEIAEDVTQETWL